jgi:hypothetical protein
MKTSVLKIWPILSVFTRDGLGVAIRYAIFAK